MNKVLLLLAVSLTIKSFSQPPDSSMHLVDTRAIYLDAFEELQQMLNNEVPISFKRAVFITENAYLDGRLSYDSYLQVIKSLSKLTRAVMAADGLDYSFKDRGQVLLSGSVFRVMKDSLVIHDATTGKKIVKAPFTYDMEDFWGEQDWTKMFVTKLLFTQSGNCHSLPALYKILVEELEGKAWLAMAPNHTYIKQWSDKTGWYNTELTTGRFPYDSELKWNSYIKTEAIADGVYMDTLSVKENIAYVITDLAQGYQRKFGNSDLDAPIQWLDVALKYYPDYLNALILKAELTKSKYELKMSEKKATKVEELWSDPDSKIQFSQLEALYSHIHQLGYRRMPTEMYLNWLFRIKKDTTRQPFQFATPQPFSKYNYDVQMVTAGDGQNYEFFDQERAVRIGSIELDRITGKILRFMPIDTVEMPDNVISRMYDPALGRWWQIDPEAEGYSNVSPYNYANNDPVSNIDPDGQDWYRYSDKDGNESVMWRKGNDKNIDVDGQTYNNIGAVFATQAVDGSVVIYNQDEVFAVLDADAPAGDAQEQAALGAMMNPEAEHHFDTMSPGMETMFFASETAVMIGAEGAYSSRANNSRTSQRNGREKQVQTKLEDLNSSQRQNLQRFIKKLPANSQKYQIRQLGNGNVQISAESPGKVPGSKALYVKEIDNTGTTVKMYKVSTDNQGQFVHNKNKLSDY